MTRRPNAARLAAFARALAAARRGASTVEYGFVIALVVLAMFVALAQMGDVNEATWHDVDHQVGVAMRPR